MSWTTLLLLLLPLCLAHRDPHPSKLASIRQLAQFSNETWVENIAVRSNGNLLVTPFTSPDLYEIDPFRPNGVPQLVARFPDALGLLGIAEISEDVFAIAKGIFAPSGALTPGSFSIWKADFTTPGGGGDHSGCKPVISRVADLPGVTIINGIAQVAPGSPYLLLADSLAGVIWRLDLATSAYDVVLNDTATRPIGTLAEGGFGVDGLRVRDDGFLYFTNTNKGFFRVPVDTKDGTVVAGGTVETLAGFAGADDFAFDESGTAYVSNGAAQGIVRIVPGGEVTMVAYKQQQQGNKNKDADDAAILLEGNTGVAFGRTKRDGSTLYVTTNGGIGGVVPGTPIEGGRVLAVELGK